MRDFLRFTARFVPGVLGHVGVFGAVGIGIGLAEYVRRDAFGLAWTAFLLAASVVLGRASDAAMKDMREERAREVEQMVREIQRGE